MGHLHFFTFMLSLEHIIEGHQLCFKDYFSLLDGHFLATILLYWSEWFECTAMIDGIITYFFKGS